MTSQKYGTCKVLPSKGVNNDVNVVTLFAQSLRKRPPDWFWRKYILHFGGMFPSISWITPKWLALYTALCQWGLFSLSRLYFFHFALMIPMTQRVSNLYAHRCSIWNMFLIMKLIECVMHIFIYFSELSLSLSPSIFYIVWCLIL